MENRSEKTKAELGTEKEPELQIEMLIVRYEIFKLRTKE